MARERWHGTSNQGPFAFSFAFLGLASKKSCASVNYFTLGRRKRCEPLLRQSSTQAEGNAYAHHIDRNRHRGRNWPDLVGRRDVQVGPPGRLRNEVGRDIGAS